MKEKNNKFFQAKFSHIMMFSTRLLGGYRMGKSPGKMECAWPESSEITFPLEKFSMKIFVHFPPFILFLDFSTFLHMFLCCWNNLCEQIKGLWLWVLWNYEKFELGMRWWEILEICLGVCGNFMLLLMISVE